MQENSERKSVEGLTPNQVLRLEDLQANWDKTHENLRNVNKRLYGILDSVAEILADPQLSESEKLSRISNTPIIKR